jgi:hypothetical protein
VIVARRRAADLARAARDLVGPTRVRRPPPRQSLYGSNVSAPAIATPIGDDWWVVRKGCARA